MQRQLAPLARRRCRNLAATILRLSMFVATTDQAVEQLGCLRGLVTAGILQQEEIWICKAAIPHLMESRGAIVNLGSVSAFIGSTAGPSKGAVLSFTYAAAGELANRGIWVNNVAPGFDGGFTHQAPKKKAQQASANSCSAMWPMP